MFANMRLGAINFLVSIIIGLAGILLAAALSVTVLNIGVIETSWLKYQADHSEKARLESALRKAIGYGGMIHHFKNYILRREENLIDNIQSDIGAVRAVIGQYGSLSLSEAEKVALEDIGSVLDRYEQALLESQDLAHAGVLTKEIDTKIRVNDTAALRGLETLRTEVERSANRDVISSDIKGRIAANLRAALGYGGMIHEFKNLILRSDLPRIVTIEEHISRIEKNIAAYLILDPTISERIAIDDISATVRGYKSKLEVAEGLINQNATIVEIDAAVKVNDAKALRGLKTLDREIASQVEVLAEDVGANLKFLTDVVPIINWGLLIIILLTVISSILIFNSYIIKPITTMVAVLNRLAQEDTEIIIPNTSRSNEIGQMARALEAFQRTIVGRKVAEAEIREMAVTDPLTGLYNRKRFDQELAEMAKMSARTKMHMACLMIDLDRFKPINDTLGHAAGDEVLRVIAERLKYVSRDTDVVARLGGDEFAIIATAVEDASNVAILAKRVIDQIGLPVYFEDHDIKISGSIGIAVFPDDGAVETLAKKADAALYTAKNAGRNSFHFASPIDADVRLVSG
jgi:diguanylate cyclase (GGDEF)-like protein